MDKQTLSNYGWIVIAVLVLAVMIAMATPFGEYVKNAVSSAVDGLIDTNTAVVNTALGSVGVDTSIGELEKKYDFKYFDTLLDAINDVNGVTDKTGKPIGAFNDENGTKNIVLYNSIDVTSKAIIATDTIIKLSGKTINCTDSVAFEITNGTVTIDAQNGGNIISTGGIANVNGGSLNINGGKYTSNTSGEGTKTNTSKNFYVASGATLAVNKATITANDNNNGTVTGIYGATNSNIVATDTTIESNSHNSLETSGIYSLGNVTLTNCSIVAKSDYTANAAGTAYASNSRGIYCEGTLELNNCYVWGAHSGITAKGNLTVNGGTYEGYGHGGFYCSNAGKTASFKNAVINWANMKDGYVADSVAGTNGAGMYVGGASNINLYFDNCDIYGTLYGVVLRGSGGEENHMVYISNSTIEASKYTFRMSNYSSRVYIGAGNGFDTTSASIPANCIITDEIYAN